MVNKQFNSRKSHFPGNYNKLKTNHVENFERFTQKACYGKFLYDTVTCFVPCFLALSGQKWQHGLLSLHCERRITDEKWHKCTRLCTSTKEWREAREKNRYSSVLRSTSQQLNKVIRDKSCVYFLFFHIFFHLLVRIGSQLAYFFKTTYIVLVNLQAVAGGKNCCFRR